MRITIVTGAFLPCPPGPAGAVERVWGGLAEEFARRGHKVHVVSRRHGPESSAQADLANLTRSFLPSLDAGRGLLGNLLKDLLYTAQVLGRLPFADIVVSNTFWLPLLAPFFRSNAGRLAVHVARMPKGQLFLYDRSPRLHAVSLAVAESIIGERPTAGRRVRVIPYPIATHVFTPDKAAARDDPPVILFAGRIHPEKGLDVLLDSLRFLDAASGTYQVRIVGPWEVERGGGGREYLDSLRRRSEGLPVQFLDAVYDRDALARVYRAASVFCYPSLAEKGETFGVAPLEAMATGLIPVVSDLACFRDFIRDGVNGRVFDHRCDSPARALADVLGQLLAETRLRETMGTAAAETAAAFNYERIADMYLKDFEEMLGR